MECGTVICGKNIVTSTIIIWRPNVHGESTIVTYGNKNLIAMLTHPSMFTKVNIILVRSPFGASGSGRRERTLYEK